MEAIFSQKTSKISTNETLEKAATLLAEIFVMQFDYENTLHLVDTKSVKINKKPHGPQRNPKKK